MHEIARWFGGLAGIGLGTDRIMKSTLEIARFYQLPQMFIGLTIFFMGIEFPVLLILSGLVLYFLIQRKGLQNREALLLIFIDVVYGSLKMFCI
jgi:Ca2+/Na+ antiporter